MNLKSTLMYTILLIVIGMICGAVHASVYNAMPDSGQPLKVLNFAVGTTISLVLMASMIGAMALLNVKMM